MSLSPVLALHQLTKVYPGLTANDQVDLSVLPGEIHAVLGENGAGKSTLMKMVYGVVQPSAGQITWRGRRVRIASPMEARRLGIGMVFQHFSLFESLTVAENTQLFLNDGRSLNEIHQSLTELSASYGIDVSPSRHVHDLSVGERQRVEILRCLLQAPKLLILDEPTSVLTPQEVDRLFTMLRRLSAEGCAILYISHKLQEIRSLCHRATVLQQGRVTGRCDPSQETESSLAEMMIGKANAMAIVTRQPRESAPADSVPRSSPSQGDGLVVRNLSTESSDPYGVSLRDISFQVRPGEILGLAGVSGNGQRELVQALSGELRLPMTMASAIQIQGQPAGQWPVARRRRAGLCVIPEDRLGTGAVPDFSLEENALLTGLYTQPFVSSFGLLRYSEVQSFAQRIISRFRVKCQSTQSPARSLSGGNLQKFIVGREVLQQPCVLVCAQPTWGVDVGAAAELRQALKNLRDSGCAILLISEDIDEIFALADRVVVAFEGRLSSPQPIEQTSTTDLGLLMAGVWQGDRHEDPLQASGSDLLEDRQMQGPVT